MRRGRYTSTFDDGNRLTAVVNPASKGLTYSYDAAGQRTRLIEPEGGRFTYSYDDLGRIKYLINPQSQRTTHSYDAAGQRTGTRLANSARVSYAYDDAGQLKRLANLKSDSTTVSSFEYAYDAIRNCTRVIEHGGVRVTWTYDALSRLTRERRGGANSYDVTYTYDAAGNRKTKIDGGTRTTYTYDAANELLSEQVGAARTTCTYDASDNQATKKTSATSVTTFTWDYENKLTRIVLPSGTRNTFTYSADGQRVKKEDTGGTTKLLWDLENILLEANGSDVTQVVYALEPALYGNIVSQRRSGSTNYFVFDALGSTDRLLDASQAASDTYIYKAFGELLTTTGTTTNPFRYVGQIGYYFNTDLANYLLGARFYDSTIGRFLSRDPRAYTSLAAADMRNVMSDLYQYVQNNPLNAFDPSGMITQLNCKIPPLFSACTPPRPPNCYQMLKVCMDLAWWGFATCILRALAPFAIGFGGLLTLTREVALKKLIGGPIGTALAAAITIYGLVIASLQVFVFCPEAFNTKVEACANAYNACKERYCPPPPPLPLVICL